MTSPMQSWVDEAVEAAKKSPCQSKRGAILVDQQCRLLASGFNDQPYPFVCNGSDECKAKCGKTAIHAEQMAILNAPHPLPPGNSMLHVKISNGRPTASMAPSCLECSKLMLAAGVSWMHLLHHPNAQLLPGAEVVGEVEGVEGPLQVRCYSAQHFHWLTAEYFHHINLIVSCHEKAHGRKL